MVSIFYNLWLVIRTCEIYSTETESVSSLSGSFTGSKKPELSTTWSSSKESTAIPPKIPKIISAVSGYESGKNWSH